VDDVERTAARHRAKEDVVIVATGGDRRQRKPLEPMPRRQLAPKLRFERRGTLPIDGDPSIRESHAPAG
jgi:hypothetical protein